MPMKSEKSESERLDNARGKKMKEPCPLQPLVPFLFFAPLMCLKMLLDPMFFSEEFMLVNNSAYQTPSNAAILDDVAPRWHL